MTLAMVVRFTDGITMVCDSRKTKLDTRETFDNSEKLYQINLNTGIVTAGLASLGVDLIKSLKKEIIVKNICLYRDIEKLAQNIFSNGYTIYIKTHRLNTNQYPLHYLIAGYNKDGNTYEITGYFSPLFKPKKWRKESIFAIGSNDKLRRKAISWFQNCYNSSLLQNKNGNIPIQHKILGLLFALNQIIDRQLDSGIGGPIQLAYITKQGFQWSNYTVATKNKNISAYRNKFGWKIIDRTAKTEKNIPTLDFKDIDGFLIAKI